MSITRLYDHTIYDEEEYTNEAKEENENFLFTLLGKSQHWTL